ncbi:MAG: CUB domain-containing protein [Bacteroidia bacterium]
MRYSGLLALIGLGILGAQSYNHPTTGVAGTYSGGCQVHTCSGTYYDNGGPGANYSNEVFGVYWTFCPNASDQCLRATFTSFSIESGCLGGRCWVYHTGFALVGEPCCYDWLRIGNGPAQNSPALWWNCGNAGPGTVTSTDNSGCLTFTFCSDGSVTQSGWAATLSCVPCTRQPTANSDCQGSTAVCSNGPITDASYGPGNTPQCGGCVTNENYTNFYIFQSQGASGNIGLQICPNNGSDDYDFAIWGPFNTNNLSTLCGSLGTPIRCSYAMYPQTFPPPCGATNACTGLYSGAGDNSEGVCGDGRVNLLNATAGQYYILMINLWTAGGSGYTLTWNLPPGMSLNCTPLSQPVVAFRAEAIRGQGVLLRWGWDGARLGENEQLIGWAIDRSGDGGLTWQTLAQLPVEITTYTDRQPFIGENLYRLRYGYADGRTETYITSQRVEWSPAEGRWFNAWYDKTQESIHIQLFDQGMGGEVRLYTIDGRLIKTLPVEPSPFLSAVGFSILNPGTYIVSYREQNIAVPVMK